jgi:hypothetical protein
MSASATAVEMIRFIFTRLRLMGMHDEETTGTRIAL